MAKNERMMKMELSIFIQQQQQQKNGSIKMFHRLVI